MADSAHSRRQRPIIPPKLHHLTFRTRKLHEMVRWYEPLAGLTPVHYSEYAAWLTNGEANHRMALIVHPDIRTPVLDNYSRLSGAGIVPFLCFDHGITMSMYDADPRSASSSTPTNSSPHASKGCRRTRSTRAPAKAGTCRGTRRKASWCPRSTDPNRDNKEILWPR